MFSQQPLQTATGLLSANQRSVMASACMVPVSRSGIYAVLDLFRSTSCVLNDYTRRVGDPQRNLDIRSSKAMNNCADPLMLILNPDTGTWE